MINKMSSFSADPAMLDSSHGYLSFVLICGALHMSKHKASLTWSWYSAAGVPSSSEKVNAPMRWNGKSLQNCTSS